MAEELFSTPGGSPLAGEAAQPGAGSPAVNPAGNVDARLAAILAKQAAGEALTHKERGYLGAIRRKAKPRQVSQPADGNPLLEPAAPTAAPADNPLFEAESPAGAGTEAAAVTTYPPERLRSGANSLLSGMDFVGKLIIGWQAREAGADKQGVESWKQAVALKDEQREMIVQNCDPGMIWLCEQLGCSPEEIATKLQGGGLIAGLGAYLFGIGKAVKELSELAKENAQRKQQKQNEQDT